MNQPTVNDLFLALHTHWLEVSKLPAGAVWACSCGETGLAGSEQEARTNALIHALIHAMKEA